MDHITPAVHICVCHTSPTGDIAANHHPTDGLCAIVAEHQQAASITYSDLDV